MRSLAMLSYQQFQGVFIFALAYLAVILYASYRMQKEVLKGRFKLLFLVTVAILLIPGVTAAIQAAIWMLSAYGKNSPFQPH